MERTAEITATAVRAKGNKTKAKKMLAQISREWAEQMRSLQQSTENERMQSDEPIMNRADSNAILFADFYLCS